MKSFFVVVWQFGFHLFNEIKTLLDYFVKVNFFWLLIVYFFLEGIRIKGTMIILPWEAFRVLVQVGVEWVGVFGFGEKFVVSTYDVS